LDEKKMPKKEYTLNDVMDKLNKIETKIDVIALYGWYFLGIALMIAGGAFATGDYIYPGIAMFVFGAVLMFLGWLAAELRKKKNE
jgi:hypothetical protein